MTEKAFQTAFSKWAKHHIEWPGAFELKVTPTDSIPFAAVKPHQVAALKVVHNGTFVFKIPDTGNMQNPFDCFTLCKNGAWVVIRFGGQRGMGRFVMISITNWVKETASSTRRSLTFDRACEIGTPFLLTPSNSKGSQRPPSS